MYMYMCMCVYVYICLHSYHALVLRLVAGLGAKCGNGGVWAALLAGAVFDCIPSDLPVFQRHFLCQRVHVSEM